MYNIWAPGPPVSDILFFDCYHRGRILNKFTKFHALTYTGIGDLMMGMFYKAYFRKKKHTFGPPAPQLVII